MGGHHFTHNPPACQKKLFVEEVKYEAGWINYSIKYVKMSEEVEPGEEVTSARRPIPASSIATEDRSDYDPTEPSKWES